VTNSAPPEGGSEDMGEVRLGGGRHLGIRAAGRGYREGEWEGRVVRKVWFRWITPGLEVRRRRRDPCGRTDGRSGMVPEF